MPDIKTGEPVRRYANWLEIGFSRDEFVLDFGQQFDEKAAQPHIGIVVTPRVARAFLDTLSRSLDEHAHCHPAYGMDEPS